jgi:hypothetical protein
MPPFASAVSFSFSPSLCGDDEKILWLFGFDDLGLSRIARLGLKR